MARNHQPSSPTLAAWAWPDRGPESADKAAYLAREHVLGLIDRALDKTGVEALLVKGSGLMQLYPSPWLRPMADIDLLLRPEQLQSAADALRAAGFAEDTHARPLTAPLLEICLRSPGQQMLVELHASMDKVVLRPLDLNAAFQRSSVSSYGATLRIPSLEDQLLLVALHFATDDYQHAAAVVDLEVLIRAGADLSEVGRRAREAGAATAVFYALSIVRSRLGDPIVTTDLLSSLAPTGLRRALLARHFDPEAWPVARRPPSLGAPWLLRQLVLRDSPGAFARGLVRYAMMRLRERSL